MKGRDLLHVRFQGVFGRFVLDVAFDAPMRGVTALFGPSGAGKSLVLRCVAGLHRLRGDLVVGGEIWQDGGGAFRAPHARPIGYVFQEPSLFPHLSVRRNLLYGRKRALQAGAVESIRFDEVVGLMGLEPLLDRSTAALSGGERQRVAVGRALLAQPRLLLMDEPLSALDQGNKAEILPYLEMLHASLSIPMLYVSHDLTEVERLADVLVLMEQGRIAAAGPLAEILANAELPIARRPDAAAVVETTVQAFDNRHHLTTLEVGGETVLVPGRVGAPGGRHRIRIAAGDVSLATERPSRTSILNVLPARVAGVHPIDEAQVNVVVAVGRGPAEAKLLARISRRACEMLGLFPGQPVYAQVKAVSLIASRGASAISIPEEGS